MGNTYKISVWKPERKIRLGGPRRDDNIKMVLEETRREDVDWMHLAQVRDRWRATVNTVMKLSFP
jgi:hypothetical protein